MTETNTRPAGPRVAGLCRSLVSWWGEDRMLVYASYGLGEWAAGDVVVPDVHVIDRGTLRPIMEVLGSKSTQLVPHAELAAEIPVPQRERKRFCLCPRQVAEIAKLAKAVEAQRGKPVEVEWAYLGGALRLLAERHPERE